MEVQTDLVGKQQIFQWGDYNNVLCDIMEIQTDLVGKFTLETTDKPWKWSDYNIVLCNTTFCCIIVFQSHYDQSYYSSAASCTSSRDECSGGHYYVTAENGSDCPLFMPCHSLSHYVQDTDAYFTSDTVIEFLPGLHELNCSGYVKIVAVENLTIIGSSTFIDYQLDYRYSDSVVNCIDFSGFFFLLTIDLRIVNITFSNWMKIILAYPKLKPAVYKTPINVEITIKDSEFHRNINFHDVVGTLFFYQLPKLTIKKDSAWISHTPTSGLLLHAHCPFDYCSVGTVAFKLEDPDKQCAFSRVGILCGACREGFSLALGTSRCLKCSNVGLALLLPFAVAGLSLVFVLLTLNFTVSTGTVNGLIFYVNI